MVSKFKIKNFGEVHDCLGMEIITDTINCCVKLSQEKYIDTKLQKINMTEYNSVKTPMEIKLKLEKTGKDKKFPYQELIGCLMHLVVLTRPDLSFAVNFLSQFNNCCDQTHWNHKKRVLRYLKGTKNVCLTYSNDNGNSIDRRSYTGFVFKLCGGSIS